MVVGDVREIADGIAKGTQHNRRTSNWTHGQLRQYITYKAAQNGIEVILVGEQYTTKTCPCCGKHNRCSGRVYRCTGCKWIGSRDGQVGAPTIFSKHLYGELARVQVQHLTYRHPFLTGKRKATDTGLVDHRGGAKRHPTRIDA
jgi:putative transposase